MNKDFGLKDAHTPEQSYETREDCSRAPIDGSLIAQQIAREAIKDREMQSLWQREHDEFHFEKPIST